jgi:hypothetical protein
MFSTSLLAQMYVSPTGSDTNPGTFDLPFRNLSKAISLAGPDSLIYLRGGIYFDSLSIRLNKTGQLDKPIKIWAYPGELPILDFSKQLVSSSSRGIQISHNYWHLKGIEIRNAGDNGIYISGWYNTVENCSTHDCKDTGLQIGGGGSNNRIINCDSYFNADPAEGNADGFAAKLDVGTNNYFYGCRAWQNSDDGWDGYLRESNNVTTIVENSWCFNNGYRKNGTPSNGNGNGYKMGGGDNGNSLNLAHDFTLKNSLAFDNRVKGYDQNNNRGSMTIYNCSAYRNGTNYSIPGIINSGEAATIINCVALGNAGSLSSNVVQQTNSWHSQFVVTNADFISIDTTGVRALRKPDGSLPDIDFLHLAPGSDLIDSGTDIGLLFNGIAPDLGAFETEGPSGINVENVAADFRLEQNYPNPFNPTTKLIYRLDSPGFVELVIFSLIGEKVTELIHEYKSAGSYEVNWNARNENNQILSSGIYIARLSVNNLSASIKISLLK